MVAFVTEDAAAKSELLGVLAKWAEAGAFLGTESCVNEQGYLITTGRCTSWQRDDGQDPSAIMDAQHSTFLMASLVRAYLGLLSGHEEEALAAEHAAIEDWIEQGFARRLKRVSDVYSA